MSLPSVAQAPWFRDPRTRAVMAALEADDPGGSRFVGGCVRNTLLGAPVDDVDIATRLTPEAVMAAGKAAGLGVAPTGLAHGTVTLIADHRPFEVTTLRRDVETDGRHAVVAFTTDWAEDAARRDFRCNALYADASGAVFDPGGQGIADARAGRVVFIGEARERLREDHLRSLRFFRFHAWYGRGPLDAGGLTACAAEAAGLGQISVERVWKELSRLLAANDPRLAMAGMASSGVLARALPEAGPGPWPLFDALVELETDAFLPAQPLVRLASLLAGPNVGEATSRARAVGARLKLSTADRERLVAALGDIPPIVSYLSPKTVRQRLYELGAETYCDRVRLGWAAATNPRQTPQWRALLAFAEGYQRPRLPVSGREVRAAGVPDGPLMGAVLREVESWWVDHDFPDDPLALLERLKAVAQALVPPPRA
jgi:poly(A) polymerase